MPISRQTQYPTRNILCIRCRGLSLGLGWTQLVEDRLKVNFRGSGGSPLDCLLNCTIAQPRLTGRGVIRCERAFYGELLAPKVQIYPGPGCTQGPGYTRDPYPRSGYTRDSTTPTTRAYPGIPRAPDLASGANSFCNLHYFSHRIRSRGFWGPSWAPTGSQIDRKPGV